MPWTIRSSSGTSRARENFGKAAKAAGVDLIVYLGGLSDGGSKHLASRHESAEILQASGVPVTYVRAAAVVGGGSESFLIPYYLVKRLPAMVTPQWARTKTQPDRDQGRGPATSPTSRGIEAAHGREIEIGGPDVTTYGGMMDAMARAMNINPRPRLGVPVLTPGPLVALDRTRHAGRHGRRHARSSTAWKSRRP